MTCGIGSLTTPSVRHSGDPHPRPTLPLTYQRNTERTKTRPLARGDIKPGQAIAFLAPQLTAGLAVLTQLNWYRYVSSLSPKPSARDSPGLPNASILLGASSLSLVTIYPLMKRVTYWPQAVLGTSPIRSPPLIPTRFWPPIGLAFNWGALLGWSAVAGAVHWPVAVPLYAGGVLWTLVYDSIYAHQDKTDDVRVGIRSTALLFGEHTRSILAAFSASSVGCIALAGYLNAQGAPFFLGTGLAAAQLALVIRRTDFNDRTSCGRGFVACGWVGFWVWMGALGDYIWLQLGANEDDEDTIS